MVKYHCPSRNFVAGIIALISFLFPELSNSAEPVTIKALEHQLGERIDKMESIVPVMEKSKSIDIALPYFNRYPHFTERLIGEAIRYFPVIERILAQYNLPDDLKYIPLFESGFREEAVSPVGATGMWQFMEGTGRKYGLTINREIDERLDFVKSTEAAARFLKSLHEEFGCWALALMAYNGGPYRVKKLVRNNSTTDVRVIMDQMPQESQTYLSKMIAAKLIFKSYKFYGLVPVQPDPIRFYSRNITHIASIDLSEISKEYNVDYTALRQANPHLKYRKIRNAAQSTVNVRIPVYARRDKIESLFRNQAFYISSVQELENLASDLKISVRKIALVNELFDSQSMIGEVISIPVPEEKYITIDQKYGPQPVEFLTKNIQDINNAKILKKVLLPSSVISPSLANKKIYYLDPSETLLDVCRRLNVSLEAIKELNPGLNLYISNRLYVPMKSRGSDLVNVM